MTQAYPAIYEGACCIYAAMSALIGPAPYSLVSSAPLTLAPTECENSKKCSAAKHHFDDCQTRVTEGKGFKDENCVEEFCESWSTLRHGVETRRVRCRRWILHGDRPVEAAWSSDGQSWAESQGRGEGKTRAKPTAVEGKVSNRGRATSAHDERGPLEVIPTASGPRPLARAGLCAGGSSPAQLCFPRLGVGQHGTWASAPDTRCWHAVARVDSQQALRSELRQLAARDMLAVRGASRSRALGWTLAAFADSELRFTVHLAHCASECAAP